MTLYALYETENNRYDDSNFFVVAIDTEDVEFKKLLIGSTRYGACGPHNNKFCYECVNVERVIPDDIKNEVDRLCAEATKKEAALAAIDAALNPKSLSAGQTVALKRNIRNKKCVFSKCTKCDGSGKWVNPHRSSDVRSCFACDGWGITSSKLRGMTTFQKDSTCTVLGRYVDNFSGAYVYVLKTHDGSLLRTCVENVRVVISNFESHSTNQEDVLLNVATNK